MRPVSCGLEVAAQCGRPVTLHCFWGLAGDLPSILRFFWAQAGIALELMSVSDEVARAWV
jgi:hypothetical protein